MAVSTITADQVPAPNRQSLFDFLQPVPGVTALNQDNAAQGLRIAIRGFGARAAFGVRGIRVQVDGVPWTLPDGQTELDALDLHLVDSLTVIRGPASALFGNAAGGVVDVQTSRPDLDSAELDLLGAGFGTRGLAGRISRADESGGWRLAWNSSHRDGPRAHNHSDSRLASLRWDGQLDDSRWSAQVSLLDISAEDPGGLNAQQLAANRRAAAPNNLRFAAGERISQQRAGLSWSAGELWQWQLLGFLGHREFANRLPFRNAGQVSFVRDFGGLGLTLSRDFALLGWTQRMSGGLDAQLQADDRRRFDNVDGARGPLRLDQAERAAALGVFVRDSVALAPHWELSAGLRRDWLRLSVADRFGADGRDSGARRLADWSWDSSLSYTPGRQRMYLRVATAYESPTNNELANPAGGGFNPALQSSRARNLELGMQGRWAHGDYSAAWYHIISSDELLPFELEDQPGRRFFRNAGRSRRDGLELAANANWGRGWRLAASASYARAQFAGNTPLRGNDLPGLPRSQAWLQLSRSVRDWEYSLAGRGSAKLYADDGNSLRLPGYAVWNARSAWQPQGRAWQLELAVDNLLDRDYPDNVRINAFGGRAVEPAGGRTYRLKLGLRW